MTDRILGYFSLLLLTAFFAVSVGTIAYTVLQPIHYRVAVFDNVKALRVEDQVFMRGSSVGQVAKVEWKNRRAVVTISSKTPLAIKRDYSLTIVDIGVMGDRVLSLDYGTPDAAFLPPGDTLRGIGSLSTTDAIGLAYQMREVSIMFAQVTELLLKGDQTHPSLIRQYGDLVRFVETTTRQMSVIALQLDDFSRTRADSLYTLVDQMTALSHTVTKKTPEYVQTATDQINNLSKLLDDVESLITRIIPIMKEFDSPKTREMLDQISTLGQATRELRTIIINLQEEGLKLHVWPF